MKASELIVRLCDLIKQNGGDLDVQLDTNPISLVGIDYVEIDPESDVVVISALSIDEAAAYG
ncbi:MAG: hypothetical protein FDZ69_07570 [Deltaproteobacteria bacterium]|nr:MAG: hypothetical protein FDZ69_07570 [Deltaproteobacteria bacterium]